MKVYRSAWLTVSCILVALSSCTPNGELSSETQCNAAIAKASYIWRVRYYSDRTRVNPNNLRIEEFASAELVNRNGEKPANTATDPDDNGVWWPAQPPRPTTNEIQQIRQFGERVDPPELDRRVKYTLQCADGELITDGDLYRQASPAFRAGETVRVSYSLGRVLMADIPSVGEVTAENPSPSPDGESVNRDRQSPNQQDSASASNILYVDPRTGNDQGTGTDNQPLKTITRAIAQAQPGTTIQLRPGSYSADTGEVFPLQLKPGVTLRGDAQSQGKGIEITGGGKFLSPTWAGQSVTVVAAKDSWIVGLTLKNPNTRGTAVWIESGSPLVDRNTFAGSNREGVFVSGNAAPRLRNNLFEQNEGNGISFTRDSGGMAEGNVIRRNGFGLAIGDRATPQILENQITQNLDGLVINGDARPTLRQNTIRDNQRDGIVVTNNAQPTLQQNTMQANGQYDLHTTSSHSLILEKTDLAGLKVTGRIN
ncbi:MAG: DUF1565 domain-containing protein [Leptolyngbyaceae cyanobacterium RU_5_1]|nr:DUF1565 domain-containing protein [Leptolyngbyaceae cyanobacterium RU_5_1]